MHLRRRRYNSQRNDDDADGPLPADSDFKFFIFNLDHAFEDDGKIVGGAKFFGGSTIKEELNVAEDEEWAVEQQ